MQGGSLTHRLESLLKVKVLAPARSAPDTGDLSRACDFAFPASSHMVLMLTGGIALQEPPPLSLVPGMTYNFWDSQALPIDSNRFGILFGI